MVQKRSMMQIRTAIAVLAMICASTALGQVSVESSRDVGHGFRVVMQAERMAPGFWEGIGHFRFLYYKNEALSAFDSYSIAPSGRYAMFQDGPTGNLILFTPATRQQRIVAKFAGSLAKGYVWRESRSEAYIKFAGHPALRVSLTKRSL